jgi:sugar lactone lactonase YvrE
MKKLALILIVLTGLIVPLACTNNQPTGPLATYNLTATYTFTFTSTPTNWAGYTSTPTPGLGTSTATPFSPPVINTATPTSTFVNTGSPSQPTPELNGTTWTTSAPPNGVAYDGSTTIYVAEGTEGSTGGLIQMFNTSGTSLGVPLTTYNGSNAFGQPNGVVYYGGNIYVVDQVNNAVYEMTPSGGFLNSVTSWSAVSGGPGSFLDPEGIAVDGSGNIYIADTGHDYVEVFNSSLSILAEFNGSAGGNISFNNPSAVAVDSTGKVYVVDASNQFVKIFTNNSGTSYSSQFWTAVSEDSDVYGITLDTNNNIYLADSGTDQIEEYTSTGTFITSGLGNPATSNPDPVGLVFLGTNSNLLVADYANTQIYSVTP